MQSGRHVNNNLHKLITTFLLQQLSRVSTYNCAVQWAPESDKPLPHLHNTRQCCDTCAEKYGCYLTVPECIVFPSKNKLQIMKLIGLQHYRDKKL